MGGWVDGWMDIAEATTLHRRGRRTGAHQACHYDESSECANVSIHEAACYRTRAGNDGVLRILLRNPRLPISILELTKNEVGESSILLAHPDQASRKDTGSIVVVTVWRHNLAWKRQ